MNQHPPSQPGTTAGDDDASSSLSKTQRKQAAHALTELGRRLVALKPQQLAMLPLPDDIAEAVSEARAINAHGARKRQLQYLGKLLRRIDVTAIEHTLTQILAPGRREAALARRAEQWRDRLLDEGDHALGELLQQYPHCDRQQLRQLIRQCQRQQNPPGQDHNPASARSKQTYRALYRALHDQLAQAESAAAGDTQTGDGEA